MHLNLNVFTPVLGPAGLPVLFWVHGGGFTHGGNTSPWYHAPSNMAGQVVTVDSAASSNFQFQFAGTEDASYGYDTSRSRGSAGGRPEGLARASKAPRSRWWRHSVMFEL